MIAYQTCATGHPLLVVWKPEGNSTTIHGAWPPLITPAELILKPLEEGRPFGPPLQGGRESFSQLNKPPESQTLLYAHDPDTTRTG